jgi:N-acetylmuramoyl-L-alanine amidase
MRGKVRWSLISALCLALVLPATTRAEDAALARYAAVRDAYLALREDAERQRFRHNYLRILEGFEAFVADHPGHPRAPAALYNAGQLAWDLYKVSRVAADLRRAQDLFRRLADAYPDDSLADDGLFLAGRILLEHGGDRTEAYQTFQAVIDRFPDGDMVPKAREMLGRLADHAPARRPDAPTTESRAARPSESPRVVARSGAWQGRAGDETAAVGTAGVDSGEGYTRISVPITGAVRFREGEVPADAERGLPRRVYLDLQPARVEGAATEVAVGDGRLRRVRVGQFSSDTVRLVLDLAVDGPVGLYPLQGEGVLVVDVTAAAAPAPDPLAAPAPDPLAAVAGAAASRAAERQAAARAAAEADAGPAPERVAQVRERLATPQEVPLSVQAGLKVRRVVIDPGHGGRDTGAVGPTGLREADVALDISKRLGEKLKAHGLEVVFTRTEDVFIPLEARTAMANDERADLFISVHANAATRRDRRGVTTYYLDVTSDRYAMRLAARENATAERSVGELQLILADLTTRHNTDESARLAARIQENLVQTLGRRHDDIRDLGVQYALFYVLLGARMPSVLVETSFISNPTEERRLADEGYREEVAQGIFDGILAFIEERNRLALGN